MRKTKKNYDALYKTLILCIMLLVNGVQSIVAETVSENDPQPFRDCVRNTIVNTDSEKETEFCYANNKEGDKTISNLPLQILKAYKGHNVYDLDNEETLSHKILYAELVNAKAEKKSVQIQNIESFYQKNKLEIENSYEQNMVSIFFLSLSIFGILTEILLFNLIKGQFRYPEDKRETAQKPHLFLYISVTLMLFTYPLVLMCLKTIPKIGPLTYNMVNSIIGLFWLFKFNRWFILDMINNPKLSITSVQIITFIWIVFGSSCISSCLSYIPALQLFVWVALAGFLLYKYRIILKHSQN